ncbi:MAG: SGNH/GDSL hydrolase family protein [Gemmatimonadaceae bacterium]
MKTTLLLAASVMLAGCATRFRSAAPNGASRLRAYPATSERIRVMGRHTVDGERVAFGASGVTFLTKFRGTSLEVELEDELRDSSGHNWFTVVVDGAEPSRFRTRSRSQRYLLVKGLTHGEHTLALSKATEGQNGRNRLVTVYAEELLQADPLPVRRIEFIGNSITAGYGADPRPLACKQGTWYDATHAWQSYAPRVARRVEAQWMLSAISGIGVVRNWNSPAPVMSRVYGGVYMDYADSVTTWDYRRYTPDLVVVSLGTNDFSDGAGPTPRSPLDGDAFVRDYTRFVAGVRTRYPRATLLLLNSPMLDAGKNARLNEYLQRVVTARAAAGDNAVSRFAFSAQYTAGCDGHPDLDEQRRMADELEPEVRARMGW